MDERSLPIILGLHQNFSFSSAGRIISFVIKGFVKAWLLLMGSLQK